MKKIIYFLIIIVGVVYGGVFGLESGFDEAWAESGVENDVENDLRVNADLPDVFIKAINPGYTVNGVANVGEMIEIGRKNSDAPMSLAGFNIYYTNSSGNRVLLIDLSKHIWMTGETFILQLASSPDSELAPIQYTKTLAFKAGPLALERDGVVLDSVCWTGKNECYEGFDSAHPTSLVRDFETGKFRHVSNYDFNYDATMIFDDGEADNDSDSGGFGGEHMEEISQCKGAIFSEILSYYDILQSEQFIELYNNSAENITLDGCFLKYKNKKYPLSGNINAEEYFVRYLTDFKLTKNPTNSNIVELVDADGAVVDKLEYYNGQRRGASYALVGYDKTGVEIWKTTYSPTPGEANNYQEYKTCEVGKVINEATGNCVKVTSIAEKICGEGKYLNILTGRCKNIPEDTGTTECKEGYYRSEETGRCRKITVNDGADYTLVPETYKEESSFVALYLVLGVVGVGLVYVGYEFRHDILKLMRKIKNKI
ncbi:hypothetical protein IKF23_00775 [Candidatus Saccharibacteria bacterium]|nr:hypothetical protein [Candidatus Saccharibacteria bacterium]